MENNMEKEENDIFTEEQKNEKMKQRLRDNGLYDHNYSSKQMKEIIDMLDESEEMAQRSQNKEFIIREQKSFDESDNHTDDNRNSTKQKVHCQKQKKQKSKNSKKDTSLTTMATNKVFSPTESIKSTQESNRLSMKNKMDTAEHKTRLNRWKMNPLNCQCNKNDVPLPQPVREMIEDSIPFRLCKGANTVEERNKVMNMLNDHLKVVSYLWYRWYTIDQSKFQWVQVDLAEKRKPATDCVNNKVENNDKDNHKEISTRKSVGIWTRVFDSSSDESDESDDSIVNPEKRKKTEDASDNLSQSKEPELIENVISTHEQQEKNNSSLVDHESINNTTTKNIATKICKELETKEECPAKSSYSKTTTAENLKENLPKTRKRFCLSRSRRTLRSDCGEGTSATLSVNVGKRQGVTDEEILLNLDNEDAVSKKDVVIKPLPLSARIAKQCEILKQADIENKKKLLAEQDKNRRKGEEERERRKQEFNKRRQQELEEEFKRQEKMQKKEQEKDKWLDLLQARNKMRIMERTEEESNKQFEKRKDQDAVKNTVNACGFKESESEIYSPRAKVTCPICNKDFASDKIENHAAVCEQFEVNREDDEDFISFNKNSTAAYECSICLSFKTDNGIDYEDHVNSCIQRKQDSSSSQASSIVSAMDAPNSPIRSFKPISQQNSTDIDYIGQCRSSGRMSRKRKH